MHHVFLKMNLFFIRGLSLFLLLFTFRIIKDQILTIDFELACDQGTMFFFTYALRFS